MTIQVGTLVELRAPCLGNAPGTVGVCYEQYSIGRWVHGVSVIFPNGNYDGFSESDQVLFFEPNTAGFCNELAGYEFTNVGKLSQDFRHGRFAPAFEESTEGVD